MEFTATARRLGIAAAAATAVLLVAYALVLAVGLATLASPDQPIRDPMFSLMEILIIALMPAVVALMVAVHAWAAPEVKVLSLTAVVFMGALAGLTCGVHFTVLTLSRHPAFADQSWLPHVMAFRWPSVVYALDILAWDVLFALSMLCAAGVFGGGRPGAAIRATMIASGVLALAGLAGVAVGDMQVRNVGIVGYVGVFLVVAVQLGALFRRSQPVDGRRGGTR